MPPAAPVDPSLAVVSIVLRALTNLMHATEPQFAVFSFEILAVLAVPYIIFKLVSGYLANRSLMDTVVRVVFMLVTLNTMLTLYEVLTQAVGNFFWDLAMVLDARQFEHMLNAGDMMGRRVSMASIWDLGPFLLWILMQAAVWILKSVAMTMVAGSLIQSSVFALFGILTIPWLLFQRGEFLFNGFFRSWLSALLTPAIAFAQIYIFSQLITEMLAWMPLEIPVGDYGIYLGSCIAVLVFMTFSLWKSSAMANGFMSGSSHSDGGGLSSFLRMVR